MTFSLVLFVVSVAVWAETVRHYRRRIQRDGYWYKRPLNLTVVMILGCASYPLVTWRACRWTTCHVWRWDINPRVQAVRRRSGARRAQAGQTPAAVLHAAAQPLALPAGPRHQLVAQPVHPSSLVLTGTRSDGTPIYEPLR